MVARLPWLAELKVFFTLLNRFKGHDRNVSDRVGPSYAPGLFARDRKPRPTGLEDRLFASAMARLFSDGKIPMEPYGYPSSVKHCGLLQDKP